MDNWLNELKVGDIVIVSNRYKKWFDKVKRLTKTQIVLTKNDPKFRKTYGDLVGSGQWDWTKLNEATPEATASLLEEIERNELIMQIENVIWGDLSTERLKRIIEIINE